MLGGGGGRWSRESGEEGKNGQVRWVTFSTPHPHPPAIVSSMLLPVTSHHHWEEMGSFSFKCLPKKKDPGLSSRSMVSQKKKKNEAASRLGTPLLPFFFPFSIHHPLAARTPGQQQLLTFPSRLPAVAGPGSVAAQLSPRWLSPRPVAVACLIGHWSSPSDPLTGTSLGRTKYQDTGIRWLLG